MKTLYWLTNDLRLDDNPALSHAAKSEQLLMIYCVDPRWFFPYRYHLQSMGQHRWNFLQETLTELNSRLQHSGQKLHVIYALPETAIPRLIESLRIDRVVCSRQFGYDEVQSIRAIKNKCRETVLEQIDSFTLFDRDQLPFEHGDIPANYSQFRRQVEKLPIPKSISKPAQLPSPILLKAQPLERPEWVLSPSATACRFRGGESQANEHLAHYFAGDLPLNYKLTRNALDGWEKSSKMSPWLNNGSLSLRRLRHRVSEYEAEHEANDSTYWLFVELLWREYFQWLALDVGNRLFSFRGNAKAAPLTSLYPERFQKWCYGNTPYPIVNACMQELLQTGYLSNRGRQIAASCLVNELQIDWRHGAAWFEHQLVDYDVAVNWGNWQYIAGVGADPRGGRHFNLDKQTTMFDADESYRRRWIEVAGHAELDTRDAADWPTGGYRS